VGSNDEAVEIVYKARIARLRACDRKVGRSATVDPSQLSYLFAVKSSKTGSIEQLEQILQPLPGVSTIVDESI
jgi:hypothetical protein